MSVIPLLYLTYTTVCEKARILFYMIKPRGSLQVNELQYLYSWKSAEPKLPPRPVHSWLGSLTVSFSSYPNLPFQFYPEVFFHSLL